MSFTHNERDTIQPETRARERGPLPGLALALLALQVLISSGAFPFLPSLVPIHWDAAGHADQYGSKWVNTLLFPGISIFLFFLLHSAPTIRARLGSLAGTIANAQVRAVLLVTFLIFGLIVQLLVTAVSLGMNVDFALMLNLAPAMLLLVIGNYLGKVRRNFWVGVRTPWSLANASVWERTHRLGSWLFVAVGLIGIPCSFIPPLRPWGLLIPIIAVSIFLSIYSYVRYQQQAQHGRKPPSSPFEGDS